MAEPDSPPVQEVWAVWQPGAEMRGGDNILSIINEELAAREIAASIEGGYVTPERLWTGEGPPVAKVLHGRWMRLDGPISEHNRKSRVEIKATERLVWEYDWPASFDEVIEVHNMTEYALAAMVRQGFRSTHLALYVEGWDESAVVAKFEEERIAVLEVLGDMVWDSEGTPTT